MEHRVRKLLVLAMLVLLPAALLFLGALGVRELLALRRRLTSSSYGTVEKPAPQGSFEEPGKAKKGSKAGKKAGKGRKPKRVAAVGEATAEAEAVPEGALDEF